MFEIMFIEIEFSDYMVIRKFQRSLEQYDENNFIYIEIILFGKVWIIIVSGEVEG